MVVIKVMGRSERAKSVVKKQADVDEVWERAWGIIANAGEIWDRDTEEAREWRQAAWAFERRIAYGAWNKIQEDKTNERKQ